MYRIAIVIGLIAAFVAMTVIPAGAHIKPSETTADMQTALPSDNGIEPQLFKIVSEINNARLDKALENTEALIKEYPNYRLAYLIKGDLLLARSAPLTTFGNADNAPQDKLNDLRDEIKVRLNAYSSRETKSGLIPRYLLQMPPEQKFAIVVDITNSRLYLYANNASAPPRLVADYYISHGKLGAGKMREGDKKNAHRRLSHHGQPIAEKSRRVLRHRRFPDQLPERMGQTPGTRRPRHLVARHPANHFFPTAESLGRLRRSGQYRS